MDNQKFVVVSKGSNYIVEEVNIGCGHVKVLFGGEEV